jgi:hypothetical protein
MEARADLLEHARTALERSARCLSDMRARLEATAPVGRQHRLLLEGAIHDLSRRYEALASLYGAMADAHAGELRGLWQQFFACYDTYLEALRATRSQLAMGPCVESRGAAAMQPSLPSIDETKH